LKSNLSRVFTAGKCAIRMIRRIEAASPELGRHLAETVRTGTM
jgi:hypothetical protein